MKLIIKNVRVIDPASKYDNVTDIEIDNGVIKSLGTVVNSENSQAKVIDGTGFVAAPGLVDIHVHFRDPGLTYKEDIQTGANAAVAGGYTTVVMMANTKPAVDSVETLQYVAGRAKEVGDSLPIHILPAACVSQELKGKSLTDIDALVKNGAAGITDDGIPVMDEELLEQAFVAAASHNVPVSLHEEDPNVISENGINAGPVAEKLGLKGSPREAEIRMIERDLPIALRTGADVNIQHISTEEGVALVRDFRQKQLSETGECHIHAEATPHHFSLTQEAVYEHGTLAKMNPPLRTEADRQAIIAGLKDGTIEIIATDHAPHSKDEKSRDFAKAPSGIIGLETALSLGITNLVNPGYLTLMELMEKMSTAPAALYHLQSGIAVGKIADIVIFDPTEERIIRDFRSKSENSPFKGSRLKGVVKYTICNGIISYSETDNDSAKEEK